MKGWQRYTVIGECECGCGLPFVWHTEGIDARHAAAVALIEREEEYLLHGAGPGVVGNVIPGWVTV